MAQRSDEDFATFVAESAAGLRRLGYARTGSWATSEDLVQDAFADAHRRWNQISQYDDPTAWARRAVLNRSVSRLRRRGREQAALTRLAARADADVVGEPVLADEELWTAIRSLPDRQRDVVLLMWFEDLAVAQVAATLGCGAETVRTHWRRARERLAEELGVADDMSDEEES